MIRGTIKSYSNQESNPSAQGLSFASNHSATFFYQSEQSLNRLSSPHDREYVSLHFLLHANQSTSDRSHEGASTRHGFPRKSHVFDDVIRPPRHVQSLTTVGVMTGVIVFLTIGTTVALALFCCKRNFRFTIKDDASSEDVEDCQMDELDVIFDDDDVIPLCLSSNFDHMTRTRPEVCRAAEYEPEVTFDGVTQRPRLEFSPGQPPHPHGMTWNCSFSPRGSGYMIPGQGQASCENSDPEALTYEPRPLSEKSEDDDTLWRATEAAEYPALREGCRDGYQRIGTEEEGEDGGEEEAGALDTSLEDSISTDAEFESAETD